jgi:hypothetical protein
MSPVVDSERLDALNFIDQFFQQPNAGRTTNALDDQGYLGRCFIVSDDVASEKVFIESCIKNPVRNAFLIPVSLLVKFAETCAIDDSVNSLAAVTTKMQLFAINFVNDQVSLRDW